MLPNAKRTLEHYFSLLDLTGTYSPSTKADGGEAPATARSHCPVRARYELHQTTVELAKKKRRDERLPNYPDHSGLGLQQGLARGDHGGSKNVASPAAQRSTQMEG
jgi:hypothetical protein